MSDVNEWVAFRVFEQSVGKNEEAKLFEGSGKNDALKQQKRKKMELICLAS